MASRHGFNYLFTIAIFLGTARDHFAPSVSTKSGAMNASTLIGMDKASEFARKGQFVFAIKLLERLNPHLSRQDAKIAVETLGYSDRSERRAEKNLLERVL